MSKKVSKAAKRRLTLFGTISIISIVYFFFNFVIYTVKIVDLRSQKDTLTARLDNMMEDETELKTEIVKLNDPEYVARYARENYQYSKNGEYIIQINQTNNDEEKKVEEKDYTVYFISGIMSISIILILKKISRI